MSICSHQSFTLFNIQSSSSSTYQPPVWLTLFLCICSHSLELTSPQRSVRFCESQQLSGNTLKLFIFNLHYLTASDSIFDFWRFINSFYLLTYLLTISPGLWSGTRLVTETLLLSEVLHLYLRFYCTCCYCTLSLLHFYLFSYPAIQLQVCYKLSVQYVFSVN